MADIGSLAVPACFAGVSLIRGAALPRTYNHRVEASTGEAGSTNEILSRLEFILEVNLALDRTIGLRRAIVEALDLGV